MLIISPIWRSRTDVIMVGTLRRNLKRGQPLTLRKLEKGDVGGEMALERLAALEGRWRAGVGEAGASRRSAASWGWRGWRRSKVGGELALARLAALEGDLGPLSTRCQALFEDGQPYRQGATLSTDKVPGTF
jgi:hypothetical protein